MVDKLPQHPFVTSVKADPSQPAKKAVVLTGLPGDSDREGYQRLYLTMKLNYYAEFPVSAILSAETVPADQSPIPGQEATQVTISRDATILYVTATSPQPIDEFDLDVRLGALSAAPAILGTKIGGGVGGTCETCVTQCDDAAIGTRCGGGATCLGHTCVAHTCLGTCAGNTCVGGTCAGQTCVGYTCVGYTCAGHTCAGQTCVTCVGTCLPACHQTHITCHPAQCQ